MEVVYALSVTNNDTGCAASTFGQTVTVPLGWTAAFGSAFLGIG